MGPFLLLDKTVIQGLKHEDIRTLCNHYTVIICPILLQEIIGNLLNEDQQDVETRKKVSILASKSHGFDAHTITNYVDIAITDLIYGKIDLRPHIPRFDGKPIRTSDGKLAISYPEPEETKLLRKWMAGEFTVQDITASKKHWEHKNIDAEKLKQILAVGKPASLKPKSLRDVAKIIDDLFFSGGPDKQWDLISSAAEMFGLPPMAITKIRARWEYQGRPIFWVFAGYAFYCFRLAQIYAMGLACGCINTSKNAKTPIDHQYLYYLPFVRGFCSWDKFHREFSSIFVRLDQTFIWFEDLRADLIGIREYMGGLTPTEREEYSIERGSYPPEIETSLTHKLWKKYQRPWTPGSGNQVSKMTKEQKEALKKRLKDISSAGSEMKDSDLGLLGVRYFDSLDDAI